MTLKACLDCGRVSEWTRCPLHRAARTRIRTANRATARQVIAASPRCEVCGCTRDLQADHIVPISEGGTNARSNQRVLCRLHNLQRQHRDPGRGPQ